jgi:hypothetical protein
MRPDPAATTVWTSEFDSEEIVRCLVPRLKVAASLSFQMLRALRLTFWISLDSTGYGSYEGISDLVYCENDGRRI